MVRITDHLDMTIVVDWDVKPQINQPKNNVRNSGKISGVLRGTQSSHVERCVNL